MGEMKEIDVTLIDMNEDNEDIFGYDGIESLAQDISEEGFHGTIEVYLKPDGRYEIVAGHRRYQSALKNNMRTIPCFVEDVPDKVAKAKRLIMSNVLQRNMTPYNWAKALDYYKKNVLSNEKFKGKTRDELARRFHISSTTAQRYLSLLNLIPEFLDYTKQPNCEYTIFDSVVGLSAADQKELYRLLSGMASAGNILSLTKMLINQTATRLLARKEQQKKAMEEQEREDEDIPAPQAAVQDKVQEDKSISEFEPFGEGMEGGFEPFDDTFDSEEKEAEISSADGEIAYFISRIDLLLNGKPQLKDKEVHIESLKKLIEKMDG